MKSFQEMDLEPSLQKALKDLKFHQPTEIQAVTLPLVLKGQDLMACAQTGSGKTAAYCVPILSLMLQNPGKNALILAPTRELAQQIADVLRSLIAHSKDLSLATLVGGADIRKQLQSLKRKPRILVATPGRLTDHLKRRSVTLDKTAFLVLDEGDRMLDMGFAPQLDVILKYLPKVRQTLLFTATLPPKVQKLAEQYLNKPQSIKVGPVAVPVETIKQSIVYTSPKEKDGKLLDELNRRQGAVIIFARTRTRTDQIADFLGDYGFSVTRLHGGRSQGQRNQAISGFKRGQFRILCSTDIAARGIDVPGIEHVINYDLPMMGEDYVHRVGRTARNGASGEAVSFVAPQDQGAWMRLVRKYKIPGMDLQPLPRRDRDKKYGSGKKMERGPKRGGPRSERTEREDRGRGGGPSRFRKKSKKSFRSQSKSF